MPAQIIMVGVGLFAGVLSGLFGIGGGVVIVPSLIFTMGYSQVVASGVSLVSFLSPVGMVSAYSYYKSGRIGWPEIQNGLWIAAGLIAGGYLGGWFSNKYVVIGESSELVLRRSFAVLLILVAGKIWFK